MTPRHLYLVATSTWFMAFGLQSVMFAWLVTMVLRESAQRVGLAQTALLLPGMLLILVAGALADRFGPDRQAFWAQAFAAITPWVLIAALQFGLLSYSVLLFYAVLMGCAQAFVTPARDGLLNLVAQNNVQRTVLLTSFCQFGFQIVGYAIAGFADPIGAEPILIVQSIVLVIGMFAYSQIRKRGVVKANAQPHRSMLHGVMEGAKTVMASPVMRVVVMQNVAMASFFMGCFIVCFPLVVREVFNGSSGNLATLNGINSAGLVLTILVMLRVGNVVKPGRALLLFQGLGSVVLLLSGMVDTFGLFVFLIFVWGLCGGVAMPMSRTLMQELAPPEQRARVMSFYAFSFMGAGPLGTMFCGYLSEVYGPQVAIQVAASLMLSVVIIMSLVSKLWHTRFEEAVDVDEVDA
jgi:MFS family permease